MQKASVTEAHLCHRCPRLLAYKLAGRSGAFRVGLKGTGKFPGSLFHDKIAKPFHAKLATRGLTRLKRDLAAILQNPGKDLEERVHGVIRKEILDPVLSRRAYKMSADHVMALADGVRIWSDHLAHFLARRQFKKDEKITSALTGMFCEPEKKIRAVFQLNNGEPFQLTGVFDALIVDKATHEAVVVEFKGFKPAHEDEDFIQAALYANLIKKNTGITPRCLVLYLEEQTPEAIYPADVVEKVEGNLLRLLETVAEIKKDARKRTAITLPPPPDAVLCAICPFDATCDEDWGPRRDGRPEREAPGEAEDAMNMLVSTLEVIKLPVEPEGFIFGPRLIRLKVTPRIEKGTTVRKIMNRAEDLQIALSLKTPPLIRAQAGHLSLDIPRKTITPLTLVELWKKGRASRPASRAAFPIGMAVDGAVTWADLTSPTMTSILVAGTAGSGKSVFLRSAALGMAINAAPARIRLTLIDPKRVTFNDFSRIPHLRTPVIMDREATLAALESLVDEMEDRYALFEERSVIDVTEFNAGGESLPHHVIIIDEYADLMIDRETKTTMETHIQRLCQKGRAAGFHLILSTQRPDAKVVTPLIKANLQLKAALKVTTATNSQVILDEPGAERLMGAGDMLVGGAIPVTRLQGAIATGTEIEMAMGRGKESDLK